MPRLARARAQRCGAALLLALLACAPTTRPAPLLDEAMRIGVPEVAEAPALDRRASVSIFVEQGSFVVEARGPGIKVERARVTDLAKEGHRITALHDALELLPLPDDAASVAAPQSVELWIPAATPFGDAVDVMYTAGHAGLREYEGIVRVGGEVRGISFRPPRFDGPPWPGACVLANVAVDAERVRLHREVWQTNLGDRDAPIPLDATGVEHALEGLAAALTEHLHVPLCPSLTVSMDDALPWGRMASVLAALQGTVAPDEIEIEIELR